MKISTKRYRGLSFRKKTGRILLLVYLVFALVFSFFVLGNLLHDRLTQAASLLDLPIISYETAAPAPAPQSFSAQTSPVSRNTPGIYCTVDDAVLASGDTEKIKEACTVAAELYDGLSIAVSDAAGIRFALSKESTDALPAETWTRLLTAAHARSLTVCAVWQFADEDAIRIADTDDSLLALAGSGTDEILFTGITSDILSESTLQAMVTLCSALKANHTVSIGAALTPAVFADADSAPRIEELLRHIDFLAVDLGEPPAEDPDGSAHVLHTAAQLYGSIPYFQLRLLIGGSEAKLAVQSAVLQEAGYTSIQPIP